MKLHQSKMLSMARKLELSHPTSKSGLDFQEWHNIFKGLADNNSLDRSITEAATWLGNHFKRVSLTRQHYRLKSDENLILKDFFHIHLAAANYGFAQVSAQQRRSLNPDDKPSLEKMIAFKSDLTQDGAKVHANQLVMMRLDSICLAIYDALDNKDNLSEKYKVIADDPSGVDKVDFLLNDLSCSQLYHNGSVIWQEILYGDTYFSFIPCKNIIFVSKLNDLGKMKAICDYRRDHQNGTVSIQTNNFIHDSIAYLGPSGPKRFIKYDPSGILMVRGVHSFDEAFKRYVNGRWIEQYFGIEEHLFEIMEVKCPEDINGQTYSVREILLVWFHLSLLAHQISDAQSDTSVADIAELLEFCI